MGAFNRAASWLHTILGIPYYTYHWFLILGLGGFLASPYLRPWRVPAMIVVVLSVVILVIGIVSLIFRVHKRRGVVNPDLDVTYLSDTYAVLNHGSYEFTKIVGLRAYRAGVSTYHCKYRWSDPGDFDITVIPGDFVAEKVRGEAEIWDLVSIRFPHSLTKGEEVAFAVIFRGTNARPFFQKFMDDVYPNGVTMRVVLPTIPASFSQDILWSPRSNNPMVHDLTPTPHSTEIYWPIKRPQIGRRYRISWQESGAGPERAV